MKWWRRHFLLAEGSVVLCFSTVFAIWIELLGGDQYFYLRGESNDIATLGILAQIFSSLLGFIIASITFLFGFIDKDHFTVFRASDSYGTFWGVFKGALTSCAVASLVSVIALLAVWQQFESSVIVIATAAVIAWSIIRLARVVWALLRMMDGVVAHGRRDRTEVINSNLDSSS